MGDEGRGKMRGSGVQGGGGVQGEMRGRGT